MRAALVSVEYDDILAITLPYNRHHFEEVLVVTTPGSADAKVARQHDAKVFETDLFYADGADFNKWRALEAGLDWYGRHGLMCLMDADVLWPKETKEFPRGTVTGHLYTPQRYLWLDVRDKVPSEALWQGLPIFRDFEWAGYTQIFHADDCHLPATPWHQIDWRHAGGADSFFQDLWPWFARLRPAWKCLHLGLPGGNWFGRATVKVDGTIPELAANRRQQVLRLQVQRSRSRGDPTYRAERLPNLSSRPSPAQ